MFRFGGARGGLHIHEGLGAADVAEGDLAQPFQFDIAHTVRACPLGGSQLAQLTGSKQPAVPLLVLVQIRLDQSHAPINTHIHTHTNTRMHART